MTPCPYCGEPVDVYVDPGGGEQQDMIEDCSICCRPMRLRADYDEESGEYRIRAERAQ
jgi:hypothetical protein